MNADESCIRYYKQLLHRLTLLQLRLRWQRSANPDPFKILEPCVMYRPNIMAEPGKVDVFRRLLNDMRSKQPTPRDRRMVTREALTEFLKESDCPLWDGFLLLTDENGTRVPDGEEHLADIPMILDALLHARAMNPRDFAVGRSPDKLFVFTLFIVEPFSKFADKVCAAFALDDPTLKCEFLTRIRQLLRSGCCGEACNWILALKYMNHFRAEEIVPSLLSSDNLRELDALVRSFEGILFEAVKITDDFIANFEKPVKKNYKTKDNKTPTLQWPPFQRAVLKLLSRWSEDFGFAIEQHCPNTVKVRLKVQLRCHIHQTFREKAMSLESFTEVVALELDRNEKMRDWFVRELDECGLPAEAAKWIARYKLSKFNFSWDVQEAVRFDQGPLAKILTMRTGDFYELKLSTSSMFWVANDASMCTAMDYILQSARVIGLDGEWVCPEFGRAERMALLQIATDDRVFLLDMIALQESLKHDGGLLLRQVFCSPNVLKLGFGLDEDLKMLSKLGGPLANVVEDHVHLFDFLDLVKNPEKFEVPISELSLQQTPNHLGSRVTFLDVLFPNDTPKKPFGGLSALVKEFLGKPLCKAEQVSNWERRPLRYCQIMYAALDAFCLVEIGEECEKGLKRMGFTDVDGFWREVVRIRDQILGRSAASEEPTRVQAAQPAPPAPASRPPSRNSYENESAGQAESSLAVLRGLKFVTDTMCQGLCGDLQYYGIDAVSLRNGDEHELCLDYHEKEGRIILSSGHCYQKMVKLAKPGYCYSLRIAKPEVQLRDLVNMMKSTNATRRPLGRENSDPKNKSMPNGGTLPADRTRAGCDLRAKGEGSYDEAVAQSSQRTASAVKSTDKETAGWTPAAGRTGKPKFVTDLMLTGLSYALSDMGYDSEPLRHGETLSVCMKLHKKENRIILTKGKSFATLEPQVAPGYCYEVRALYVEDQIAEVSRAFGLVAPKRPEAAPSRPLPDSSNFSCGNDVRQRAPTAGEPRAPIDLKFVADTNVQGVGKRLQQLGCDVIVLRNGSSHEDCYALHARDKRIILSFGYPGEMMKKRVGDKWCFCVRSKQFPDQVKEVVEWFGIPVSDEELVELCKKTQYN